MTPMSEGGGRAYRNYLGPAHARLELYSRRVLAGAEPGAWHRFHAATAADAATVDQCIRYIVRQERPATSARVEWLRADGSWADGFPRPADRRGHTDAARLGRELRAVLAGLGGQGDGGGFDPAELAGLARVQSPDGQHWYAARLRLGPKRGTVPPPESPRPRASVPEMLRRALSGDA